MVPIILAAILSTEPLDCGDSLYLINDSAITMGIAETEQGEFYFGFDFTSDSSYCSSDAPSTEITLGENKLSFKKVNDLPHSSLSTCTYVFGRDFFLSHKLDIDRIYHTMYIADDEMEQVDGVFNITENNNFLYVTMNGTCDIQGSMPLGVLRHGGRLDSLPSEWKTDHRVANFALTSGRWPVWYTTGATKRFGLALVPGNLVRIDLNAKRISWAVAKDQGLELILGEYAGYGEVYRIEANRLFFYLGEEGRPEDEDNIPSDEVVSIGGADADSVTTRLREDPFGAIFGLRRAESLVYKAKDGTHKTYDLDLDPEDSKLISLSVTR